MRRFAFILLLAFFTGKAAAEEGAASPLTLNEAYRLALKRSEGMALAAEEIEQAEARFYRSLGVILPDVSYKITRFEQDVPPDGGGEGATGDARRRTKPEQKFVFSQPIFSGFKEFAALASSGADKKRQRHKYQRARELLFADVVDAYYSVLQDEKDVEILSAIRGLLAERLKELEQRVRLGQSRESELKTSGADLRLVEADLAEAEAAEAVARNLLEFIIGQDVKPHALSDGEEGIAEAGDLSAYLPKSLSRLDVRAAEEGYALAENKVIEARSGFIPKVSLDGNYYTKRVGFQSGNDWDFTVKVDVPIFDGAQTLGDVKEAASLRESARLELSRAKRLAELDIRDAFEDFRSAERVEASLFEADKAARENFEILTDEYRLNLVNNLEVLEALRRHEDLRRRYNAARYETVKSYWKLKVALGEVS